MKLMAIAAVIILLALMVTGIGVRITERAEGKGVKSWTLVLVGWDGKTLAEREKGGKR